MPLNQWNWYRAVGTGNDHKTWLADNPQVSSLSNSTLTRYSQVEDGRDGGNIGFDDDDRGQFEDECSHMMTRLKLNYYRAEDEMLIMERIKWRKEEEERKKERKKAEKELAKIRAQKNKEWRERREEERKKQEEWFEEEPSHDFCVEEALRSELKCPLCSVWMMPPAPIYQCEDGHVLCAHCRHLPYMQVSRIRYQVFLKCVIGMS